MNKIALVTGGAQRIGAALCRHLHGRGYTVALHYRHSAAAANKLADELNEARADSCSLWQADLEDIEAVRELGARFLNTYPSPNLLVNNASGFAATPIESATEAEFDAMLGSNLKGPYFLVQALLPGLRAAGGSVVNLIDLHAERPLRDYNAYCAAKAGLASLTRSLALELGPEVRVNGVAPGAILWPENEDAYDGEARAQLLARTPLGRLGNPEDIARTVGFLAEEAPYITGQVLAVDGGLGLVL